MILAKSSILQAIEKGEIKIEPFSKENVGPASIDLHLGNTFRTFKKQLEAFPVTNDARFEEMTEVIALKEGESLTLKPGEAILGITVEKITLAPTMSGWIEGRSRFARIGLGVHITSGFMQPGISNHQVLEISNLSPTPLALRPGVKVCQVVFQRCEGEGHYNGTFQGQERP